MVCIFCENIYHRSCVGRKKNLIFLNGNLIVCCTEKITSNKNNQHDAVVSNQIERPLAALEKSKNEIELLKNKLDETESQI